MPTVVINFSETGYGDSAIFVKHAPYASNARVSAREMSKESLVVT